MLKNKNVRKILSIVLIAIIAISILFSFTTIVNADESVFDTPEAQTSEATTWIRNKGGVVLGVFQAVGTTIAVIMLVWLGVRYILASPDGKAEIKKQAFAYILGSVLLFGATAIIQVVKNVAKEGTDEVTSGYVQTIQDVQKS